MLIQHGHMNTIQGQYFYLSTQNGKALILAKTEQQNVNCFLLIEVNFILLHG
jgi:hypothetical protein